MTMTTNTNGRFHCDQIALAAFIHSTQKLKFVGCEREPGSSTHCRFIFLDPHKKAHEIQAQYEAGGECSAASYYDSLKRLRKLVDLALRGGAR